MRRLSLLTLLAFPLLLAACGSADTVTTTEVSGGTTPGCRPVAAASVVAQSVAQGAAPAPDWSAAHVAGQVLIVGSGSLSAQGLAALSGVQTQQVAPGVVQALTPTGTADEQFARQLEATGLKVQPNFVYRPLATPNDPGYPGNAGVTVGKVTATQDYLTRIKAPAAWAFLAGCGLSPTGATVGMIDSQVDTSHAELSGRVSAQQSFLSSSSTHYLEHGTATTGVIGANTNNGAGLSGVEWGGPLVAAEVLNADGGTTVSLSNGIKYALAQGARVINMSLGGADSAADPGDAVLDQTLATAAGTAVLIAAAGNTAADGVYYPASNANVIAVGAVGTSDATLACYSARPSATLTRALDIVAPGGAGYGACSGATRAQDLLLLAPGNTYALEAGTSFSAPQVSGVVALMRAANPDLSAAQIRTKLLASVDSSAGLPLLDADAAVRSVLY